VSIDEVIARSRIAGGFSEHKRFTLARGRAIEKLRRFALADPHDYVLEFVQAAVANGAQWVALSIERTSCSIAYIGGGLREHELATLFDFLFASKDRVDLEHLRALALGINAALLFAPKRVVIESGDGTLAGTHRMVLQPHENRVDIGRADRPLHGTFVALEDIDRDALPNPVAWGGQPREAARLEERCLCAPIPIVVDGAPLFGFSRQRTPALFGFRKVVSFDEGDLYGAIGIDPGFANAEFRLLTRGVAIQSKVYELLPGHKTGGVVCFDRLHKTVDHAGIVEDERFAELWLRLRPYAERLLDDRQVAIASVHPLGGVPLPGAELARLLRETPRVVVVPALLPASAQGRRAQAIGRALQAPVLCAAEDQHEWLYALSGRTVGLVRPDLGDDEDVAFYGQAAASMPARPWVTSPIELPPCPIDRLAGALGRDTPEAVAVLGRTLGHAPLALTLYTPVQLRTRWGLEVELLISERLAWQGTVAIDGGGHRLVVRLQDAERRALHELQPGGLGLAETIAEHAGELAAAAIAKACARALADRTIEPHSPRAWLGVQAVLRSVVPRLRTAAGVPSLRFLQIGDDTCELLGLPLWRTHAGAPIDLLGLAALAAASGGVVLGAAPGVELGDVDPRRVLELDADEQRMMRLWLGPAVAVMIERGTVDDAFAVFEGVRLAQLDPLRATVGAPWLLVGGDATGWSAARRGEIADAMVRVLGARLDAPADDPGRLHALLHLQWAAVRSRDDTAVGERFFDLPLFVGDDDRPCRLRDVIAAAELGALRVVFDRAPWPTPGEHPTAVPTVLRAAPAIAAALAGWLPLRPSFDTAIDLREPPEQAGLLVAVEIDDEDAIGRVGIPRSGPPYSILVIAEDGRSAHEVHELAVELGGTGVVRARSDSEAALERVLARIRVALVEAVDRLRERVSARALTEADHEIAIGHLLELATRSVRLDWNDDGTLMPHVVGASASAILHMPILASRWGGPVGSWWALVRFCRLHAAGEAEPVARIVAELGVAPPPVVLRWMQRWFNPTLVPTRSPIAIDVPPIAKGASPQERLCVVLERWIARMRPDQLLRVPARVQMNPAGVEEPLVGGVTDPITLNEEHPLIQRALARPHDPELLAWLLLAIYAEINAVLDAVLNTHELAFQQRVVEALLAGELSRELEGA
jgi:hypothetical protein